MDYDQKLYVIITEKYPVLYESIKLWRLQMLLLFNKKKFKKKIKKKKLLGLDQNQLSRDLEHDIFNEPHFWNYSQLKAKIIRQECYFSTVAINSTSFLSLFFLWYQQSRPYFFWCCNPPSPTPHPSEILYRFIKATHIVIQEERAGSLDWWKTWKSIHICCI